MMFFNYPKVRKHLLAHHEVYTLRVKKRREGMDLLVHGSRFRFVKIGVGEVTLVRTIKAPFEPKIRPYVGASGFKASKEWLEAFRAINDVAKPKTAYLFHVRLMEPSRKPPTHRRA